MTTITSQVHPEAVSGWSPIGPLVSGMGSSLAFTILTGLAERRVFPLPSAFRTDYSPRCLSAQGQSRDLQHFSPMLTRGGNSALRDMAHMPISPIQTNIPHRYASFSSETPGGVGSLYNGCSKQRPSNHRLAQERGPGKHDLPLSVEPCGELRLSPAVSIGQGATLPALGPEGLQKILTYKASNRL
jgi:hypothetical protein